MGSGLCNNELIERHIYFCFCLVLSLSLSLMRYYEVGGLQGITEFELAVANQEAFMSSQHHAYALRVAD